MTAPREFHEQIDQLSPEGLKELRLFLERQAFADRQMHLLREFAAGWTPDEVAAFEAAMTRRPKLRASHDLTQGT